MGVTAINEEVQRASAFVQPLFAELNAGPRRAELSEFLVDRLLF